MRSVSIILSCRAVMNLLAILVTYQVTEMNVDCLIQARVGPIFSLCPSGKGADKRCLDPRWYINGKDNWCGWWNYLSVSAFDTKHSPPVDSGWFSFVTVSYANTKSGLDPFNCIGWHYVYEKKWRERGNERERGGGWGTTRCVKFGDCGIFF